MTYLRNNIVFRRGSAGHFATFYHAKSLLLGQVLDSATHTFSSTAREILLQYFSVTTEVLMKIEIEFIKSNSIITDKLTTTCASLLCEGMANMKTVITDNPSDFDPKLTNIWVPILDATLPRISYRLATLIHDNIYESFGTLVNYCVGYLNHILYVLHEIDYLCYNGAEPFMYLDKWDIKMKVDEKGALVIDVSGSGRRPGREGQDDDRGQRSADYAGRRRYLHAATLAAAGSGSVSKQGEPIASFH